MFRASWPVLVPALLLTACGAAAPAPSPSGASSSTAPKPSAAAQLKPLKIAFVAISTTTLPMWIAEAKGFYKQQGLDAQVTYVQGSTTAIPSLVAGELQVIEAQAAASVQAQLQGQDTVSLATHVPYADVKFVSSPKIGKIEDLKGKSVAVTKPGTVTDVVARAVLPKYGLMPDKDVRITYVDTQPGQLAALQNGVVDTILVPPPFDETAKKLGMQMLLDVRPLNIPYPTDGVVTTRKFLRENPDLVNRYLKAFVQAVRFAPANADETKKILSDRTKETDPAILEAAYKTQMNDWANPPLPTIEGIQTLLPLFPGGQGKNPADFIDPAPLEKAIKELDAN
ncbi:MAG TPA: ABC transporter substrate-binding protein [Chloroflexota bacterium]|nr:ABC transporter substrate-binding protein [Chloroflexota bacterium]